MVNFKKNILQHFERNPFKSAQITNGTNKSQTSALVVKVLWLLVLLPIHIHYNFHWMIMMTEIRETEVMNGANKICLNETITKSPSPRENLLKEVILFLSPRNGSCVVWWSLFLLILDCSAWPLPGSLTMRYKPFLRAQYVREVGLHCSLRHSRR